MEDIVMQIDGEEEVHGLDYDIDDRTVTLICSHGYTVDCPVSVLVRIPYFKDIEECDNDVQEIKVQNISMYTMNDILAWVKQDMQDEIKDLPMPLPTNFDMARFAGQWVADFVHSRSVWVLFKEIAQAANYLRLAVLANYACAEISIRIKPPKTPAEFMAVVDTDGKFSEAGWTADHFTDPKKMATMQREWEDFLEGKSSQAEDAKEEVVE